MKRILLLAVLAIYAMPVFAVRGRPGVIRHRQPDGSVVEYVIIGDEFGHYMKTTDGCAVCLDESTGALCYAYYDGNGAKHNSHVAVGAKDSQAAMLASRSIPLASIGRSAAARRNRMAAFGSGMPTASLQSRERSAIILLAQFSDLPFSYARQDFQDLLNSPGYSVGGATGSVLDYFNAQFGGDVTFTFDVGPVVTLSHGYAYYGKDDENGYDMHPEEVVAEACHLSDNAVDFSKYDCLFVIYAGGNSADGGADDDHLWPHSWNLREAGIDLRLDGKRISQYAMTSELMLSKKTANLALTGIGTFCHEFSHTLGLPDLYDTDYEKSGGESEALWLSLALMDGGNYNNDGHTPPMYTSVELELLGLVTPEKLAIGQYELKPLTHERRCLRADADVDGEYFLFECREASGWDRYIGGSGMLVYHIDRSSRNAGYSAKFERVLTAAERWNSDYNEINCRPGRQCADLVEAKYSASSVTQVFFPYGANLSFSATSNPAFTFWSGEISPYSLNEIRKSGTSVLFSVSGPITMDTEDIFQDAAILDWHTDVGSCKNLPCKVTVTDASGHSKEVNVPPYSKGLYSYTPEGLTPGMEYQVTICYVIDGADTYPCSFSFTTSQYGGLPYIHTASSNRRHASSSMANRLPLRVCNARGAESVTWYFDGREVSTGDDGYYHVTSSGCLKAVVDYADGTQEIMIKDITVM